MPSSLVASRTGGGRACHIEHPEPQHREPQQPADEARGGDDSRLLPGVVAPAIWCSASSTAEV